MPYELIVYRQESRAWAVPRLVETLEQARTEALEHIVDSHDSDGSDLPAWEQCEIRAQRIPQSGGKIGPLPDGYMIEVRPIRRPAEASLTRRRGA